MHTITELIKIHLSEVICKYLVNYFFKVFQKTSKITAKTSLKFRYLYIYIYIPIYIHPYTNKKPPSPSIEIQTNFLSRKGSIQGTDLYYK